MGQVLSVVQRPHVHQVFSSLQARIMVMEALQMQNHIFSRLQVLTTTVLAQLTMLHLLRVRPTLLPVLPMTIRFAPFVLLTQKTWPLAVGIRHVVSVGERLRIAQYVEVQFKPE